eukprot:CAMPEP_0114234862 /NCGR_PEP_ID=MMETSP0058-20121206/5934_1 /TAXON_ID=36894 /ORGANISM="Pyramimonas parkeae, CCMP726" /LENGTH=303 /DNA_ID=CAMNT_0001346567 /DNA_START=65 /DNA_END=976 /DNA_ORIENTATION=-
MTEGFDKSCYRLRWAVNSSRWEPEEMEWRFLLGLLPEDERTAVLRFKFVDDQKRALISRLLQRRCCEVAMGMSWDEITIKRTKGRKPFLANLTHVPEAPNFNYNVSHEGNYVVLASEPVAVCGIDCAAPQQLRKGKEMDIHKIKEVFSRNFTDLEWRTIMGAGPDNQTKEDCFRCHWSLKEAFTKARGDGIAFELNRCEFIMNQPWEAEYATVNVDGVPQDNWSFSLHKLSDQHWVSVGRGPPCDVIDANGEFSGTFSKPDLSPEEIAEELHAPSPCFSLLTIADLVPPSRLEEFEASGGDVI